MRGGDNFFAIRETCDGDQPEACDSQWDSDDGQAHNHTGYDVPQRQPPSRNDEPNEVHDRRTRAGTRLFHDLAAERPKDEEGNAERCDSDRDSHNEDTGDHTGDDVAEE